MLGQYIKMGIVTSQTPDYEPPLTLLNSSTEVSGRPQIFPRNSRSFGHMQSIQDGTGTHIDTGDIGQNLFAPGLAQALHDLENGFGQQELPSQAPVQTQPTYTRQKP